MQSPFFALKIIISTTNPLEHHTVSAPALAPARQTPPRTAPSSFF
jgi:hypothetical protein